MQVSNFLNSKLETKKGNSKKLTSLEIEFRKFKCEYTILTGLDVMYNKVNHTPIRGVRDFPD
jgi:hypothetical protein